MNILRCCTGFLSGLFATRPDGQSGRRGFVIGVMIGAMLMVGAPGWLPQGGVIPAAQAKPPTPTILVPPGWHGVHDEIELVDVVGDPLDFPDIFSRTPISVGTHDGWWLLATGNIGPFTLPMPDLDQDGVVEIGQAWDRFDHHELQIWLSSVGPRGTRQPDIVIAERFNTQTHAFSRIGAAEDVDGDGVREITTLGVATNRSNNQGVPILSVYRSTTGRPSLTLFGSDADILMAVLEGRATGHRADNLLSVIRDSDPLVANFSAERSRSGLAQALGTVVATEAIQEYSLMTAGMAISSLVHERANLDTELWSNAVAEVLWVDEFSDNSPTNCDDPLYEDLLSAVADMSDQVFSKQFILERHGFVLDRDKLWLVDNMLPGYLSVSADFQVRSVVARVPFSVAELSREELAQVGLDSAECFIVTGVVTTQDGRENDIILDAITVHGPGFSETFVFPRVCSQTRTGSPKFHRHLEGCAGSTSNRADCVACCNEVRARAVAAANAQLRADLKECKKKAWISRGVVFIACLPTWGFPPARLICAAPSSLATTLWSLQCKNAANSAHATALNNAARAHGLCMNSCRAAFP